LFITPRQIACHVRTIRVRNDNIENRQKSEREGAEQEIKGPEKVRGMEITNN
jgi:hypothetical protein